MSEKVRKPRLIISSDEEKTIVQHREELTMAKRPVFIAKETAPFYQMTEIKFEWNGGLAKVQKQKNITALHQEFLKKEPDKKVLEISSKSMQEYGEALSAFFLLKNVPELEKKVPVECVFQGAKTFAHGGPYKDLLDVSPREAKQDERLKNSGALICFTFENQMYPLIPRTVFYDYIYINALLENEKLAAAVLEYDAFTDIEFNPDRSLNCQAKAAACFVGLCRAGLTEKMKTFETFAELFGPVQKVQVQSEETETKSEMEVKIGDRIKHKLFGNGTVVAAGETSLSVEFEKVGRKKLGKQWCLKNCEVTSENNK